MCIRDRGCGRLSQGQTMRGEGRHVPHMSPFTVELILTAVHCLLIGRPRAPSSPTAREIERCHEGSRWRPSPGSLAQPTTLRDRRPIVMSLSRTWAPLEVMSTHRFQSIVNCKGGKGPSMMYLIRTPPSRFSFFVPNQRDLGGASAPLGGASCAPGAARRRGPLADGPSRGARPVGVALTRRARPPASSSARSRTVRRKSRQSK